MQPVPPCSARTCCCRMQALGVPVRRVICGFYLFMYLFFLRVMLSSEIPKLPTDPPVRVFPGVWKLLPFLDSLPGMDLWPLPLLSLFLSFIFCPTSFWRQWAAFLGAWCPLPAFRVVLWNLLSVQMFFHWTWEEESGLPILFLCHLRTAPTPKHTHTHYF